MNNLTTSFSTAIELILSGDSGLMEIVLTSIEVSFTAVMVAAIIAIPIGTIIAMKSFPGRGLVVVILNSLMGLPPVVLGLLVYLLLSRAGPLGEMGLLFTVKAMIIAQTLLVFPIIAALTRQTMSDLYSQYSEQFSSFRLKAWVAIRTLMWEGRYSLLTAVLAGFGRASAEVGAVMIVGGNINHVTRVMTTTIAMETSKGDFSLALALGIILLSIVLVVNLFVLLLQSRERHA